MPTQGSLSPSPLKRPQVAEHNTSSHSLSSSNKQPTHKLPRAHVVGRTHSRIPSQGKNLSNLARNTSATNVVLDSVRSHQRKRSGNGPAGTSPKPSPVKRNSSSNTLTRNALSQVNIRKNHSATALTRNISHPTLKKSGLAPLLKGNKLKPKKKTSAFDLGDKSSDEGDFEVEGVGDAEWEDSASQSPELTRNNSMTSSQIKTLPPDVHSSPKLLPDQLPIREEQTYSPPKRPLQKGNHSAPDLTHKSLISPLRLAENVQQPTSPAFLSQNPRSTRAPPAMSTVLAHATNNNHLPRNNSSKSFTHITHADASSSKDTLVNPPPGCLGPDISSASPGKTPGGVSHFILSSSNQAADETPSSYDSPSAFLSNYRPQPAFGSTSQVKPLPSRTQQRLELERRETLRSTASSPPTPVSSDFGFGSGFPSATSLHSRQGSRGRREAGAKGQLKADYEAAAKQLGVVTRFRNPIIEALNRLKERGVLAGDLGLVPSRPADLKRPPSRRGQVGLTMNPGSERSKMNGDVPVGLSRSFEEKRPSPMTSRPGSRGTVKVRFGMQRQGSHDDLGVERRQSEEDEEVGGDGEGRADSGHVMSAEAALLRRMWDAGGMYDEGSGG